jgi:hypothetical protein
LGIGLATRLLFPNMKGMSLEITEELIARQTPEAQAIIRALLDVSVHGRERGCSSLKCSHSGVDKPGG